MTNKIITAFSIAEALGTAGWGGGGWVIKQDRLVSTPRLQVKWPFGEPKTTFPGGRDGVHVCVGRRAGNSIKEGPGPGRMGEKAVHYGTCGA